MISKAKPVLLLFSFFLTTVAQAVTIQPNVIYGDDDRLDLYQVEDPALVILAHSTVALVKRRDLSKNSNGYQLETRNYGDSYQLCKTEPFRDQNAAAFCSGFLVSPTKVVTAGHCIRYQASCDDTSFVFDFAISDAQKGTPTQYSDNQVYHCKKLIHSVANNNAEDFAVVELDRPVTNRTPLTLRQQGQIDVGQGIFVIGHPAGLPTKVAGGASVRSQGNGYFVANLDTYGGNSGSAVFNKSNGQIEGILVRGEMDFIYKNGCRVSNVCQNDSCRGEDVTKILEALPYIN